MSAGVAPGEGVSGCWKRMGSIIDPCTATSGSAQDGEWFQDWAGLIGQGRICPTLTSHSAIPAVTGYPWPSLAPGAAFSRQHKISYHLVRVYRLVASAAGRATYKCTRPSLPPPRARRARETRHNATKPSRLASPRLQTGPVRGCLTWSSHPCPVHEPQRR